MRTFFVTTAVLALFGVCNLALSQEANRTQTSDQAKNQPATSAENRGNVAISHNFRSEDLIGLTVRNKAGEDVGRVNDLVVDLQSGDIRYVAVSHGGVAGIGGKMFAVPWHAMTFMMGRPNETDARYFVFDVTKEQLEQAKGFDTSHWPNVADQQWAKTTNAQAHDQGQQATQPGADKANGQRPNVAYETVFRASKLDGLDVRNDANEDLGAIDEAMIDVTKGKVQYLILSHGTVLTGGNKLFAIPLSQVTLAHANDETYIKFNTSQEALKNAPSFTSNRWPGANDNWWRDVDTYYERTARRETTTTNP